MPNNPWQSNLFDLFRNVVRLSLWLSLILNVLMAALFAIVFTGHFLWHLWGWCSRTMFSSAW